MGRRVLLAAVLSAGCSTTFGHSVHSYGFMSLEPVPDSRPVEAEETEDVVLGFIFDTDYVDRARDKLLAQCPDAELVNVKVKFSTDMGFLAYRQRVHMRGECVAASGAAQTPSS